MRDVSAKAAGSVVLIVGAMAALAAGVLLPVLGGLGLGGAPGPGARPPAVASSTSGPAAGAAGDDAPTGQRVVRAPLTGAVAAAAMAPADTDMVLVVENAADLRLSPVGDAAAKFLVDAAGAGPTREAWAALAAQLGWDEEELFDRLLGRRVVLVARGFGDARTARWALLSDIAADTDQRLRGKLEASPRAIDKGHQILSIEKGKYELTSHPRERGGVTIVLGPTGKSELFDEMVGLLARGGPPTLDRRAVIAAAERAAGGGGPAGPGRCEVLLLGRLETGAETGPGGDAAAPAPADRWSDFFVLAGGRSGPVPRGDAGPGREFVARTVYRDHRRREANLAIEPSSDAVFRALEPGSLLAIVQSAPVQDILGEPARVLDTVRDLPLPEQAKPYLVERQVIALREAEAAGGSDAGARHIVGVLGVEARATAKVAPILDGSISRFVGTREQQFGIIRPAPVDFAGRLPGVTRVLPLTVPDGNPLRLFVPGPLALAWSYPDAAGAEPGTRGWWVMSIAPAPPGLEDLPEQSHRAVVDAVSRSSAPGAGGAPRRWIWLGSARPAEVESLLPSTALVPDVAGFRTAMKRIERMRVELSIGEEGDIQGEVAVRLSAEGPPRAGAGR